MFRGRFFDLLNGSSSEVFQIKLRHVEEDYARNYTTLVWCAIYAKVKIEIPELKQAFFLAFSLYKTHRTDPRHCLDFLTYGIRNYPDSGFQEMKHNFEEWVKENG